MKEFPCKLESGSEHMIFESLGYGPSYKNGQTPAGRYRTPAIVVMWLKRERFITVFYTVYRYRDSIFQWKTRDNMSKRTISGENTNYAHIGHGFKTIFPKSPDIRQ